MKASTYHKDKEFVWGVELLRNEFEIENQIEKTSLAFIRSDNGSRRLKLQFDEIGSGLSLLSQIASCSWGCNKEDHLKENLLGRFVTHCFSSIRSAIVGYYNESLGQVRSAGELANLIELFAHDPAQWVAWTELNPNDRWKQFKPAKVREKMKQFNSCQLMPNKVYSKLCELSVHTTPESAKFTHQFDGKKYVGAEFSVAALILVLNELTFLIGGFLNIVGHFRVVPTKRHSLLSHASKELYYLASDKVRVHNYEIYFEKDELVNSLKGKSVVNQLLASQVFFLLNDRINKRELDETGSTSIDIYNIEIDNRVIIPFFSSERKANHFLSSLPNIERKKLVQLALAIKPVIEQISENVVLVLNYKTEFENEIDSDTIQKLRDAFNQ